jgi:hypothetical protein
MSVCVKVSAESTHYKNTGHMQVVATGPVLASTTTEASMRTAFGAVVAAVKAEFGYTRKDKLAEAAAVTAQAIAHAAAAIPGVNVVVEQWEPEGRHAGEEYPPEI